MAGLLDQHPVPDCTLPGFFLPLVIIYDLNARPRWRPLDRIVSWSKAHWAWAASLLLGLGLALWPPAQSPLIGFSAPIQWWTAFLEAVILAATLMPSTRASYRLA
jgi:hypothetical protein